MSVYLAPGTFELAYVCGAAVDNGADSVEYPMSDPLGGWPV